MSNRLQDIRQGTRLSVKLIGATLLFAALVTLGNSLYIITSERRVLEEQMDAQGASLARAASIFSIEPLLIRDYPVLETFAENMVQEKHDVLQVRIFRADGRLIAQAQKRAANDSHQHRLSAYSAEIKVESTDSRSIGRVEIGISTRRSDHLVTQRLWTLGGISFIAFMTLGMLMFLLIRKMVATPLRVLADMAGALGNGDLDTAIALPSQDELGTLAKTLDGMRCDLKRSYSEIKNRNRELKKLDHMKDEFLAKITHEIKTPLNGILGLGSAIQAGAYGEIQQSIQEPIETMQRSALRLEALADQLLSFGRHSDQVHPQVVEEIDLESFLRKLLGRYSRELVHKSVHSECRVEPGLMLRSDAILLQRIFDNLVANAVKFTESGQVQLIAESIGDAGVAISVTDTGIGIPQDVQPRIYDRFEQGFNYETRRYEGAGIGLALVKQTVEQIHGLIQLQSAPGKGSRFTVILPRSDEVSAADLASEWESGRTDAFDDRPRVAQAPSPAAVPPPVIAPVKASLPKEDGDRAKVLVVDDDRANRMVVNRHLRSEYTILEAENGEQSLAVVSGQPVDLVLLDLMMPGLSGFDVLERMNNNPEKEYPRVIVLSALMDSKSISRALRLGAVDYLTKPFNRDELLARVRNQVSLAQRELDLEQKVQERAAQLHESNRRLDETFQQLLQSEKMASIGQLAAGVAHEINNPVGFVYSNLTTLSEYVDTFRGILEEYGKLESAIRKDDKEKSCMLLKQITEQRENNDLEFALDDVTGLLYDTREGTDRVKAIVQGLTGFARVDESEMAEADINEGIETTLKVIWNELKYKCDVHKALGELPMTSCNIGQLNQVFTNLLVNAAHSIEAHGEIHIHTESVDNEIVIRLSDTGNGIAPEHIPRLFDPFFTTKPIGQGTGLGLYLTYEIIRKHKGTIEVESEHGKGTLFTIRLPVSSEYEASRCQVA